MFFKAKPRGTPVELLRSTAEALAALSEENPSSALEEKGGEEIVRSLQSLRFHLIGDVEAEPNAELVASLAVEAVRTDFLLLLISRLRFLEWEGRKEAASVWEGLVREEGICWPYLDEHRELIMDLIHGYESVATALASGAMLRECIRSISLARFVLESPGLDIIFHSSDLTNFDVASDAFTTLKELLRRHKQMVAEFLSQNFSRFFVLYEGLLTSDNYVTRRQSLKLLGEMLLDRANVAVMMRFIGDVANLRLMMTLLKDNTKSIQYEAFHVFKVFVANPNKPEAIVKTLKRNREKILKFLHDFDTGKEDEDFEEEKALLKREIDAL